MFNVVILQRENFLIYSHFVTRKQHKVSRDWLHFLYQYEIPPMRRFPTKFQEIDACHMTVFNSVCICSHL